MELNNSSTESNVILTVEPKESLSEVIDLSFDIPVPVKPAIKKEYTLKQNSWHAKLMKATFGYHTSDFTHMCPYFWLSVLNILLIPFTFLIRKPMLYMIESIHNYSRDLRHKKEDAKYAEEKVFCADILAKYKSGAMSLKEIASLPEDMFYVFSSSLNYDLFYLELRAERNIFEEHDEESKKARKKQINERLNKFKWVANLFVDGLITFVLVGVCYGIYRGIAHMIENYSFNAALAYGTIIGIMVASIVSGFFIVVLIRDNEDTTYKVLRIVFYPLIMVFIGIVALIDLIGTMYSDNCPPINWK